MSIIKEKQEQRTLRQNNSLHLWLKMLADELNGKGMYMQVILRPTYELRWDTKSCKEHLFKPILKALYKKDSTTELTTDEVSKVHEQLMLMLVEKFPEINFVDFPSEEISDNYYQSFEK